MKADEMALENARQIKAYCTMQSRCEDCVFYDKESVEFYCICKLVDVYPRDWDVDKE